MNGKMSSLMVRILLSCFLLISGCQLSTFEHSEDVSTQLSVSTRSLPDSLLTFTGEKQIFLGELDAWHRATQAHIQLQYKDKPTAKREKKITVDPVGWHNYHFPINDEGDKAWLMNRGHLVGYQFSGLNNELRNLVPMTALLNTGSVKGTNEKNVEAMLFYEEQLAQWLKQHKNAWLDYRVTPIYDGVELIPRQVELQYAGISETGDLITIRFNTSKEIEQEDGTTTVILDNVSPNAVIYYVTGTAKSVFIAADEANNKD